MKRLFLFLVVFVFMASLILTTNAINPTVAFAKTKVATTTINIDQLIGQNINDVIKIYGKQTRIDASEYGFDWYVFNKDYKRFMMIGVKDRVVVAAYCNSNYLLSQNYIKIGMKRAAVRKKFGDPITCIQVGNTVYVYPNTDKKDIFLINGYYLYVYYDIFDSYKVTSVMQVKKDYDDRLAGQSLELTSKMITAYSNQSIDLVNSIRARRGLSILNYYSKAAKLALSRSTDMRNRNYFSHYTPDGKSPAYQARKMGLKFSTLCENIAYGHKNAISAFEAFMNSKGHRSNILYHVKQIGTGTAFGNNHSVYVTYILLTKK